LKGHRFRLSKPLCFRVQNRRAEFLRFAPLSRQCRPISLLHLLSKPLDFRRKIAVSNIFPLTHHPQLALAVCMALARCGRRPRSGGGSWRRGRTFESSPGARKICLGPQAVWVPLQAGPVGGPGSGTSGARSRRPALQALSSLHSREPMSLRS